MRERAAAARAKRAQSGRRWPTGHSNLLEPLESRVLLSAAIGTIPSQINPDLADQVVYVSGSSIHTLDMDLAGPSSVLYKFVLDGVDFTNNISFNLLPTSLGSGSDAALAIYDENGNLLDSADTDVVPTELGAEGMTTEIDSGLVYILGVYFAPAGPPIDFRLTVNTDPQVLNTPITIDPDTGIAHLDANTGEDTFNTPTDVDFYELDLFNGGAGGTVMVTPTGLDVKVFATLFRQIPSTQRWAPIDSDSDINGGSVALTLTPPMDKNLQDGRYMLAVAPLDYDSAARSYEIDVATTSQLAPVDISGEPIAQDFHTPLPLSLGLGRVLHADSLVAGTGQVFKFRAPADTTGLAKIKLQPVGFEPVLSVYDKTGTTLLDVVSMTATGDVELSLPVMGNDAYLVRVGDVGDDGGGTFTLTVETPYTSQALALNPLVSDASVTLVNGLTIGSELGARIFRIEPAFGVDVLAFQLATPGSTGAKLALRGSNLSLLTKEIAPGETLFFPVDLNGVPGSIDVYLAGTSPGTDTATLKIGQVNVPHELDLDDFQTEKLDLNGDLSTSSAGGAFGTRVAEKHYQVVTDPESTTVIFGDGLTGAVPTAGQPLVAQYRQGGSTKMDLVGFALPTEMSPAMIEATLAQDTAHGFMTIALDFDGTDTLRIDVVGEDAQFVGVGMVPDPTLQLPNPPQPPDFDPNEIQEPQGPYFSVLKIRDIQLEHDFERHLWKTLLPFNMRSNAVPQITLKSDSNSNTSPFFGATVTVTDKNGMEIASATNFPGGPVLTINLDNIDISLFQGQELRFQVDPLQNQLLNDGFYSLEMRVQTDNPFPFLVTETAWKTFNTTPDILFADTSFVGQLPQNESVKDIIQNQFGDGFFESSFTSSQPYDSGTIGQTGSIDVFRFWVETPGPVSVRTVPISETVNTSLKLYQPRFNADGTVRYLGQIPDVGPSLDWFPADRSQIDAQSYINDFDVLAFNGGGSNLMREDYPYLDFGFNNEFLSGGFYYAVVKNEQGTTGQYRIEVDVPDFPQLGNFVKRTPAEIPEFDKALDRGKLTYFQPTGGSATLSSGIAFTEDIAEFVGYYPLQLPDYHGGELTATPNFFSDWGFEAFDSAGNLLPKTTFLNGSFVEVSEFDIPSGPQTIYLRAQENGVIVDSLADVELEVSARRAFPIGFFAPPATLPSSSTTVLPTDPFANGGVDSVFSVANQSQAFSFRASSGPITVNVAQQESGSMRLRWGVYVDGQRIAWDQTSSVDDTSLFGIPTEGTTTVVTLPTPRPPLDTPDFFFDTADKHDVVVYVQALDTPTGSGAFSVSVESEAQRYIRPRALVMNPLDLFANGTALGVTGNEWLRLDVPDDLTSLINGVTPLVDLEVDLVLAGQLFSPSSIRVDVYDLKGNLLTSRTESTSLASPLTHTFNDLEGVLSGNSYYLRVSRVVNTATLMNLTAKQLLGKASTFNQTFGRPPETRGLFDTKLHRMVLTPEEGVRNVGFVSNWDAQNPNLVFAAGFWVNEAGLASFSGKINGAQPSLHDPYVALYKGRWTPGNPEFPFEPETYHLDLVDYTNSANVDSEPGGNFYRFQANLEPGFYVVLGESDIKSTGGSIFVNLADYEVPDVVLDPNYGMSTLAQYWDTTHHGTVDGFGNRFTPNANQVIPGFRTSYYKMAAPSGSQAGMLAYGTNLLDHSTGTTGTSSLNDEARVHIWRQNDLGFFFRDGDPTAADPLSNAVDPPNHSVGQAMSTVDAKPGQTFWIGLHRDALDTKIGLGALFTVPFSGDPDLATETPQLSPNNGQTRVDITVRNLGFAPALFFDREYRFTDTSKSPDHTEISFKQELPIGPLGSRSFVFDWVPVEPEDFVEYFADSNDAIDEPDETNNDAMQILSVVDPTRPSVSLALQDPLLDGNTNAGIWGRYIAGVTGVQTNVIITGTDPDGDLYQVVGRHPNLQGFPSQDGQYYSASQSGSSDTSNINFVDFGKFEYTNPQNPNKFKMQARDAFGLLSDESNITAQVEQFPGWLDNEDSELTFDLANRRYDIMFRNALVDWGPTTLSQLAGFSIPFIGDLENQVLAEITAAGTAGLNPNTAIVMPVMARALVRILGEDIVNETWTGADMPTDHFALLTNLQVNSQSLATDWLSVTFKLVDLPLFAWESPEITLFAYGVPGVASINAYLQFLVSATLNAGVTIAIDPGLLQNPLQLPEILGLTTPTFVAPTITPGIAIGGEIEILGFDLASLEGSIQFGFTPALGLPSTVANQLIPFPDFFNHACLGATGELTGEIGAEVLGIEVFSFDLPSANFNFNPSCTVVQSAPLPAGSPALMGPLPLAAPQDFEGTTVFHGGNTPVGQVVIDPVPNIVIDPATGEALYVQVVDADPGINTRNNLVYAQRSSGVWDGVLSDVAGGSELNKHISNPVLALTHDDTDVPAVILYQAIDESGTVEALTRNAFLAEQDIRYRYFDGTTWGSEQSLTNDSLYDTGHTVSFNSSGQGVAAWVQNTNPIPLNLTTGAMDRALNEVQVAVWDDATHTWGAAQPLTVNSIADSKPSTFAGEDGTLYVLWIQDTVAGNQVMYSTNTGTGWSASAALAINGLDEGKFTNVAMGSESPGRVDVLFSHVLEHPDMSTEVRLFNRPTTIAGFATPTASELVAENANFTNLRTLRAPDGSLVAYWQQSDGVTIDVFAATFDQASSTWSRPLRISDGDIEYTPSLAIDTDGTFQLVYEDQMFTSPAPSPSPDAPTPQGAPPVGMPVAGNVASSSTAILPELGFSRQINFPLASKAPIGTVIASDAQIINRGPAGDSVMIEYIIGDINAPVSVESETIFLGPGARYDVDHGFEVQEGDTAYSVRVTALGGAEVNGPADNVTTTMLLGALDLAVTEVTLSNPDPVEGETVTVTAKITNHSKQKIKTPFRVKYIQGDPDFTFDTSIVTLGSQIISEIGGSETITFPWTVPTGGGNFVITVLADSDEVIVESTEFNNKGQSDVAVVRPDAVALGLVATELNYSGVDNVEIIATVTNRGRATINNLEVAFMSTYDDLFTLEDDPGLTYQTIDTQTIPVLMPGQTVQITGVGDGFAGQNNYRVVVDPNMHQIDGNWSNNVEDTPLILQGLSDLQVDILGLDPDDGMIVPMPIQGDPLTVHTLVSNDGILTARDFKVEVFATNPAVGNLLVGSSVVTDLAPLSAINVDIPIDTTRLLGDTSLLVIVDRLDKVLETNENNNRDTIRVVFKEPHRVATRRLYYARSAFVTTNPRDGSDNHDTAIASDKEALMPGDDASFLNYTSYDKGINGIIIDIENPNSPPKLEDFIFSVGNDSSPNRWGPAPRVKHFLVRPREGVNRSTRVEIGWDDGDIQKQWLQVTVLANERTALLQNDVSYFGNAIGETGDSATDTTVGAFDTGGVRDNPTSFLIPARIDNRFDFDRNKEVDAFDFGIARNNATSFLNELSLISPPLPGRGGSPLVNNDSSILMAVDPQSTVSSPLAESAAIFVLGPIPVPMQSDHEVLGQRRRITAIVTSPENHIALDMNSDKDATSRRPGQRLVAVLPSSRIRLSIEIGHADEPVAATKARTSILTARRIRDPELDAGFGMRTHLRRIRTL